ncbi:MAG: helix-turn-helix domain-containing protein, partial [Bdellovibrionales bacterium]
MKPNVTQEAQSLREVIKKLLKKNGLNYRDLATELKLTEAAVKKLMKEGDFKIQRLEIIANWFGYTLFELIEMAKRSAITPFTFSNEQEIELSKNPKALYVLLLLAAGFSLEQIKINADMKESEIRRNVFLLDRIQLIKLMPNDKLKMNCRGP